MIRRSATLAFLGIPLAALALALSPPRTKPAAGPEGVAVPAGRVIAFSPMLWIYLTVDEGRGHLLAVARYQTEAIRKGLLHHVFPTAGDLPIAATAGRNSAIPGDPEQVLLMAPDAVFSWSRFSEPLRRIGAPLVPMDLGQRDDLAAWRLAGTVAGRTERVEALIARQRTASAGVIAGPAALPDHPRALYLYQTDPLLVAFPGTRESAWLDAVGAVNAAAGATGPGITRERMLAYAPDVIIISNLATGAAVRAISDDPAFRNLPAVRDRRVYRQPTGGMRMEGPVEEPALLQWLAEIVHKDALPRRFRSELRDAYAAVYGVALSDDAIDETLHLEENGDETGFDRFLRDTIPAGKGP